MVQTPVKLVTLEEFLQLPKTKPASEYIDGQIVQKPMPKADHSEIQGELASAINGVLRSSKIGRAFPELRCTFMERSIVPDIAVLSWKNIPRDEAGKLSGQLFNAPDWIIEILSLDQNQTRVVEKILHALAHGMQMGWLIDPGEESILAYNSDSKISLYKEPEQLLPTPTFAKDFKLTVGDLVSWLYK